MSYQREAFTFLENVRVGNYVNISMIVHEYGDVCTMDFKYVKVHHITKQFIHIRKLNMSEDGYSEHKLPKHMITGANIHGNEMPTELVVQLWEQKHKRMMADFSMLRKVECVICYNSITCCQGRTCDTCNHSVCFACNIKSENAMYEMYRIPYNKLPCPMCRTPYTKF